MKTWPIASSRIHAASIENSWLILCDRTPIYRSSCNFNQKSAPFGNTLYAQTRSFAVVLEHEPRSGLHVFQVARNFSKINSCYNMKMNSSDAPSIIQHAQLSLQMTPHSTTFVPRTATFCAAGISTGGKGALSVFELRNGKIQPIFESSSVRPHGIKCTTMGASSIANKHHLATGDFGGYLSILDIGEGGGQEVYATRAGAQIINAIDGVGGYGSQ